MIRGDDARLRTHDVTLRSGDLVLRPLTEDDWGILERWNRDPDVMHFAGDPEGYGLGLVRSIYRGVCKNAFCFMMELNGRPIGECYLQKMNLDRILDEMPGKDLRRIDIMIGEKELWGRGFGTEAVRMLIDFGLEIEKADAIFGCDVSDRNVRSVKMFRKLGFEVYSEFEEGAEGGAMAYDMILTNERYRKKD